MNRLTALNSAQRKLVAGHTAVVRWAIYDHITVHENIYGLGYDDLFQEGCLWLCKAAATYDGETAQFVTYAQVVVKNGLLSYCKQMYQKQRKAVSMDDLRQDASGDEARDTGSASGDTYDTLLSDTAVFGLLESVKSEYSGIARLGIEALELKVKGYTGAEIARMWGAPPNHVGAWISRAKAKLRQNERFMAELSAA